MVCNVSVRNYMIVSRIYFVPLVAEDLVVYIPAMWNNTKGEVAYVWFVMLDYDLYVTVTVCCSGKWLDSWWGVYAVGTLFMFTPFGIFSPGHLCRQYCESLLQTGIGWFIIISYYHYICICIIICKSCFVQLPVIVLVGLLLFIVYYYL